MFSLTVPILSQPEGRELQECVEKGIDTYIVPILSQPEGRELPKSWIVWIKLTVPILSQPEGRELQRLYQTLASKAI